MVLQACVTYQAPTTYEPIRPAEYYQGYAGLDEDFGDFVPALNISASEAMHYPWWSLDYYYLGSHLYRPSYWYGPRRHVGIGPNYWSYYGFYSPFYYPYSTYAWYDPWYGWPRYGIGTNLFFQDIYHVARDNYRAPPGHTERRVYGVSRYSRYGDPFNDPRDRAPYQPVNPGNLAMTPGTRTGDMEVRRRSNSKIGQSTTGSTAARGFPGTSVRSVQPASRSSIQAPRTVSRPSPVARPAPAPSVRMPSTGKKHKN